MAVRSESGYDISHDRANEVTYKVVMPGQFVIHLRSFQGGFAHSAVEGITSPAYTVFGFKETDKHDDYFWKTVFMSKAFVDRLKTITYGIRDGRSISFSEFGEMALNFPELEEQKKKEELTLEEAFNKLETVISKMENEDVPLEESFQLYSEGMGLLKDVNDRIDRVEKQVQKMQADGSLVPMPPVGE